MQGSGKQPVRQDQSENGVIRRLGGSRETVTPPPPPPPVHHSPDAVVPSATVSPNSSKQRKQQTNAADNSLSPRRYSALVAETKGCVQIGRESETSILHTSPLSSSRKRFGGAPSLSPEENPNVIILPRGGMIVKTKIGPIQFGIPPETIKDSLDLGIDVPRFYVLPSQRFNKHLGPNCGINVAEFEFPAYMNFFFKRRPIRLIVNTVNVEKRIRDVFQETLLGPVEWDSDVDFAPGYPEDKKPDLKKEMAYFRQFGSSEISVDMLLQFSTFNDNGQALLTSEDGTEKVTIDQTLTEYILTSNGEELARVPTVVKLPIPRQPRLSKKVFIPPLFAVTVLGSSHGFDPKGKTSGYVLWVSGRGIMIDPPPNSTVLLQQNNIPPSLIDGVIVTHCHADHDAGTFQKILQEGRVSLYTTSTIMGGFIRKYAALSGLTAEFLRGVFQFHQVRIGEPVKVRGATFKFFYTLHSIPCIGFEVFFGGKSIVFSADHMNNPSKIEQLCRDGILSPGRCQDLLSFPYDHDVILHEAGVPPIHTPVETLAALPGSIKQKLYVVHVAVNSIPTDSGLRVAVPGVENTISLDAEPPVHASAIEALHFVSSIPIFQDLGISFAGELLSIAKLESFKAGQSVVRKGQVGDCFYIISSGVAEVVVSRRHKKGSRNQTSGSMPKRLGRYGSVMSLSREVDSIPSDLDEPDQVLTRRISTASSMDDTECSNSETDSASSGTPNRSQYQDATGDTGSEQSLVRSISFRDSNIRTDDSRDGDSGPTIKYFTAGDYFGEQALLASHRVRSADIYAVTDLRAWRFDVEDCNFLLRETSVLEHLLHLATTRSEGAWEVMMSNKVLCQLSSTQKTQLEGLFRKVEFRKGDTIWDKTDPADKAVLIRSGVVKYQGKVNVYRRNSGVRIDLKVRRAPVPPAFMCGAFLGNIDAILAGGKMSTTLVAMDDGDMHVVDRDSLLKFFQSNPGVLLSMLHTHFVDAHT